MTRNVALPAAMNWRALPEQKCRLTLPMSTHVNPAYLHSALTERIIALFLDVYDELGFGFLEYNYQRALELLIVAAGLKVEREVPVDVRFRGTSIGTYRMDMVVDDRVVVEVKSTLALAPSDERQLLNYLRATQYEVGLLLHFGPKPRIRRLVLTNDRKAAGGSNITARH